jgi:hypothetical protein
MHGLPLLERQFRFGGEQRQHAPLLRMFLAPQRARAKQPAPPQSREVTLAKRAERREVRKATPSREFLRRADAGRRADWHRLARLRRAA